MKEQLTIEQKAKAYDEALNRIKECTPDENGFVTIYPNEIFPELKESEDERIRKEIISHLKYLAKYCNESMPSVDKWLTWLEKQGEQKSKNKSIDTCDSLTINSKEFPASEKRDFGYFSDSSNKIEPRFHVGDWVVRGDTIAQILDIQEQYYVGLNINGKDFTSSRFLSDDKIHLWTIQDAKDGDVLVDKSDGRECPFIFKETKPSNIKTDMLQPLTVLGYCGIGGAGFTKGSGWGDTVNCTYYPATKEQRNILFKAMTDAGYTFDFEKKVIKKRN